MGADLILPILAAILSSTVLATLVTAYISRRKIGAEAEKFGAEAGDLISKAATNVVNRIEADNLRLREANDTLEQRLTDIMRRMNRYEEAERDRTWKMHQLREQLMVHAAFDYMAITKLREAGIDIGDAPPLMPDWVKHE